MSKAVIIMGSRADLEHSRKISEILNELGVETEMRVASAHKTPVKVLDIIKEYADQKAVFITVAGRSNALSGFVDANTTLPVIACPPYSEKFSGADIYSSLRMPSGVAPVTVIEPRQAGLAAAKMLALEDKSLKERIGSFRDKKAGEIEETDREVKNGKR
jgi:5-(carboxyamino)imidazole ribonucleotide mutase